MTTYAEYLKQGNKFNKDYLAKPGSVPKMTKGDNAGHRFKLQTIEKAHAQVVVTDLRATKTGKIIKRSGKGSLK
jgi:hypothetical protein